INQGRVAIEAPRGEGRPFIRSTTHAPGQTCSQSRLLQCSVNLTTLTFRYCAQLDVIFIEFRGPLGPNRTGSTAWRCKSSSQRDGGEVIAKRKGEITLAARRGPKEAWSKDASR